MKKVKKKTPKDSWCSGHNSNQVLPICKSSAKSMKWSFSMIEQNHKSILIHARHLPYCLEALTASKFSAIFLGWKCVRWSKHSVSDTDSISIIWVLMWLDTHSDLLACPHKVRLVVGYKSIALVGDVQRLLFLALILVWWTPDLFKHGLPDFV